MTARPIALITGASSGIGRAFALALTARGYDAIVVARRRERLDALAAEIGTTTPAATVHVIELDLTQPSAAQQVADVAASRGLAVQLLVNDAGFGTHGRFVELDAKREVDEIQLNCVTLVALTHAFLAGMVERGRGGVINVASTAALQPVPYMAVYGATKAFVLSFSLALHEEVRGRGVTVTALCPGATATEFFDVAGRGALAGASQNGMRSPAAVVTTALTAFERKRPLAIDGWRNQALALLVRVAPRPLVIAIGARLFRPRGT